MDTALNQAAFAFDTPAADPSDRVGFEIGWDHARHALVPQPDLMRDGTSVSQGWQAGRAVFGRRTLASTRAVRQWLRLRLQAWREGVCFELLQVTPHYLAQLDTSACPVTRRTLGGAPDDDDAPVVARLCRDAAFAAGNLAVLSAVAARALAGTSAAQALDRAQRMARDGGGPEEGLDAAAWARLATLASFAIEQPHLLAVRVPLRALPPNRVRVLNAAQGLQALLTLRLSAPGWSRRARAVAELLPRPDLRHDFNLFVGALAARLMEIPADAGPRAQRWVQEDAWSDARVQRRWQHFAGQLTAPEAEQLLQRVADAGLGGMRLLVHERAHAIEGWSPAGLGHSASPLVSAVGGP